MLYAVKNQPVGFYSGIELTSVMMNQFQGEEMMEIEQKGRITFQDLVLMVRIVIQNLQNGIMITAATNVYVDGSKLTRDQLLRACCEALGVHPCNHVSLDMDPLGKTDVQVCGSQIRNLLSTLNKSTRRPRVNCNPHSGDSHGDCWIQH
ncbi:hypothetical protein Bbelb_223370 [Branchiostoma belcheri]|nr:hypothetical protein Bbelb_223370 [Branchiostoma belcheri]